MNAFVNENVFRDEKVKTIIPSNKDEIRNMSDEYLTTILKEATNRTKIKSSFINFDALDMAEIEYFNPEIFEVSKILVMTVSEGLKEYMDWYSERYHMKNTTVIFAGTKIVTKNKMIVVDFVKMNIVEMLLQEDAPYDLIIEDLDKVTINLLKRGGNMIIRCNSYDINKIVEISKSFERVIVMNSSVNTMHVYLICKNKGNESKSDIIYDTKLKFFEAYAASKTDTLNINIVAYNYNAERIKDLWTMPKDMKIKFSTDPQYMMPKIDISDVPIVEYEFKKPNKMQPVKMKNFDYAPKYEDGLIIFKDGYVNDDKIFSRLTDREKFFMKSFTKEECVDEMISTPIVIRRIYKILSS